MADIYVDDAATGLNDGTSWTDAYTTMSAAASGASAGDDIWVIDTYNEVHTNHITLNSPNTYSNPVNWISATGTGKVFSSTRPQISTTNPQAFNLNINGCNNFVNFHLGPFYIIALTGASGNFSFYEDCIFQLGTSSVSRVRASIWTKAVVTKCQFYFQHASQHFRGDAETQNYLLDCSLHASSTAVSTIINSLSGSGAGMTYTRGGDFSGMSASGNFITSATSSQRPVRHYAEGVRLPSGAAICTATGIPGTRVEAFSVGSGSNLQNFEFQDTYGSAVDELVVYRTAAKSIYDQSSSHYSIKVTPKASCSYFQAFKVPIWSQWVAANPTLTVEIFYDAATSLTDANCWIEVEYPDSTNTVYRQLASTRAANITTTGTNLTTSALGAGDWTGESGSNQNFQKIAHTVSGGAAGMHRVWFCIGVGATTPVVYVCPDVDVT